MGEAWQYKMIALCYQTAALVQDADPVADADELAAIDSCIADALAFERGLDRMSTSAERPGNVHHRKGDACPVCGDTVRAVEYNAYEVDYCPRCQTAGKVLADNTTSKFLK